MRKILVLTGLIAVGIFGFTVASPTAVATFFTTTTEPPGRDPCSHGATGKPCKPDPQPEHGKDCDHHGNNGGVNEDHCKGQTTTTTTTTTGTTTTITTGTTTTGTTQTTGTTTQGTTTSQTTGMTTTSPPGTTTSESQSTTTETTSSATATAILKAKKPQKKVGVPTKVKKNVPCPEGTRKFHGRCHAIIKGQG